MLRHLAKLDQFLTCRKTRPKHNSQNIMFFRFLVHDRYMRHARIKVSHEGGRRAKRLMGNPDKTVPKDLRNDISRRLSTLLWPPFFARAIFSHVALNAMGTTCSISQNNASGILKACKAYNFQFLPKIIYFQVFSMVVPSLLIDSMGLIMWTLKSRNLDSLEGIH
jgi:hypothetical protein